MSSAQKHAPSRSQLHHNPRAPPPLFKGSGASDDHPPYQNSGHSRGDKRLGQLPMVPRVCQAVVAWQAECRVQDQQHPQKTHMITSQPNTTKLTWASSSSWHCDSRASAWSLQPHGPRPAGCTAGTAPAPGC